ncbi:MAG: TrbC/VirB2 family protein [Candidatus Paceibacterota bacterium]
MKKTIQLTGKNLINQIFVLVVVLFPIIVYGQGGDVDSITIQNPLQAQSFEQFLQDILSIVVQVGMPVIALGIIYSGFLFVTAGGNDTNLIKAKKTFLWVIVGAAIVLGAFVISSAIRGTIGQL